MSTLGKIGSGLVVALLSSVTTGTTAHAVATSTHDSTHHPARHQVRDPIVIGHRGAAGYRPEHTLESYRTAIDMGADHVEPDLVSTEDGVLVARHENEIGSTTDVAEHPEFASRRTTKTVDGVRETGWFTEDFTLAELRTLRAKERLPQTRPGNTAYDGRYQVPTFDEILTLVQQEEQRTHRTIGVYVETKHPSYFRSIGLPLEQELLESLRSHGIESDVFLQSFDPGSLRRLARMTTLPLIQLIDSHAGPARLRHIASYADGIGPDKSLVLPADGGRPTHLVRDAHRAGLLVHVFTLRRERQFLTKGFDDLASEARAFFDAGVDGVFSDNPDVVVRARDEWLRQQRPAA